MMEQEKAADDPMTQIFSEALCLLACAPIYFPAFIATRLEGAIESEERTAVESIRRSIESILAAFEQATVSLEDQAEACRRLGESMHELIEIISTMKNQTWSGWTQAARSLPRSWIPRRQAPSRGISPRKNRGRSRPGGKWAAMRAA